MVSDSFELTYNFPQDKVVPLPKGSIAITSTIYLQQDSSHVNLSQSVQMEFAMQEALTFADPGIERIGGDKAMEIRRRQSHPT